jgi:UDP-N-acetylglucosamine 2-epimerase
VEGFARSGLSVLVLWPNIDAGSDEISKRWRILKDRALDENLPIHFVRNVSPEDYGVLLKHASCILGNSSSGIREAAFLGTPAVNVGSRQHLRERGANVIDVNESKREISSAVTKQIEHGPYPSDKMFGDGTAGEKIVDVLSTVEFSIEKQLSYLG